MDSLPYWMSVALKAACHNEYEEEVPVGAVLVYQDRPISVASNQTIKRKNPLAHAEMLALEEACRILDPHERKQSTLFVTLEPCPMCMGAILHAHIGTVVFGAYNLKWGSCGTVMDMNHLFQTHSCCLIGGIGEAVCAELLHHFFHRLRLS